MIQFYINDCYTKFIASSKEEQQLIEHLCTLDCSYWIKAVVCPKCGCKMPSFKALYARKWMTCKDCKMHIWIRFVYCTSCRYEIESDDSLKLKETIDCPRCKKSIRVKSYTVDRNLRSVMMKKDIPLYKNNFIPTGAMSSIISYLQQLLQERKTLIQNEHLSNLFTFEIYDERQNINGFPIDNNLPELRPYQKEALKAALEYKRGIIHWATGSGKTIEIAAIIFHTAIPALIMVPTLQLLDQTYDSFKTWSTVSVGKIGDNIFEPADITIATAQTLNSRFDTIEVQELLKSIRVIILDEIHHININQNKFENTWYKIAMATDAYFRFGMTATPGNEGSIERKMLEFAIGPIIHYKPTKELVNEGWLSEPIADMYNIHHEEDTDVRTWSELEKKYITENKQRNDIIRVLAEEHAQNGTVLVSVNKIKHGEYLQSIIQGSEFIQGKTDSKTRQETIDKFQRGKLKVLVTTLLKEGADIPSLQTLINAGGGAGNRDDGSDIKSGKSVIQKAGRTLRITKGKTVGRIIDFIDKGVRMLRKHSKERMEAYEKAGFTVNKKGDKKC